MSRLQDSATVMVRGNVARAPYRVDDTAMVVVVAVNVSVVTAEGRKDGTCHVHLRLHQRFWEAARSGALAVGTRVVAQGAMWPWPSTDSEPEVLCHEIAVTLPLGAR